MRKIKYLGILLVLLISSSCKDDMDEWQKQDNRPLPPVVLEARNFFEEYVEEAEMSMEMRGLYPGNFAPDWSKAVVTVDKDAYTTVNVPIVSEVSYEGTFASYYDAEEGASQADYYTAVGQKMIVVKDPTGAYGCYLVTIIPDEANATKSSYAAAKMFDSGDENTTFSGTALFATLGNGDYVAAAGRYMYGERYAASSWWWETSDSSQQFEEKLYNLLGSKKLYAKMKTMNKEFGFDITLPTFTVTAPGPGSTSSIPTIPTPTIPTVPNPQIGSGGGGGATPSNYNSSNTVVGTSGGGGTNATPTNHTRAADDKFFYDKDIDNSSDHASTKDVSSRVKHTAMTSAITQTQRGGFACVPFVMAFIDRLFGGNKGAANFVADYFWLTNGTNVNRAGIAPPSVIQTFVVPYFEIDAAGTSSPDLSYRQIIYDQKCVIMVPVAVSETRDAAGNVRIDTIAY